MRLPTRQQPRHASSPESECHERGRDTYRPIIFREFPSATAESANDRHARSPVGPGGRRSVCDRDRRARQRGRLAALSRRRHREPRRRRSLRAGLGTARRRPPQTRPAAGRTAHADRALRRPPRRRAVGARDARARVGLRSADRHHRRAGARQPRAVLGHGAVVRRPVRARRRPAASPPTGGRQAANRSPSAS